MRKSARLLIVSIFSLLPPISAFAAQPTISWVSDTDGDWNVASNWKDSNGVARVPNGSDDVLIDRASHPTVTISSGQSVNSVVSTSAIVITGSLTIAAASEIDGGITVNGAGINGAGFLPGTLIL